MASEQPYERTISEAEFHVSQIHNTTRLTRHLYERNISAHVNALGNDDLRVKLAQLLEALAAFERAADERTT